MSTLTIQTERSCKILPGDRRGLPFEIWQIILSQLSARDLCHASRVCKTWNRFLKCVDSARWKELYYLNSEWKHPEWPLNVHAEPSSWKQAYRNQRAVANFWKMAAKDSQTVGCLSVLKRNRARKTIDVGPGHEHKSLRSALSVSTDYDRILVHPGIYDEQFELSAKTPVEIVGCGELGSVILVVCLEQTANTARLSNLVLRAPWFTSFIFKIRSGFIQVDNCIFEDGMIFVQNPGTCHIQFSSFRHSSIILQHLNASLIQRCEFSRSDTAAIVVEGNPREEKNWTYPHLCQLIHNTLQPNSQSLSDINSPANENDPETKSTNENTWGMSEGGAINSTANDSDLETKWTYYENMGRVSDVGAINSTANDSNLETKSTNEREGGVSGGGAMLQDVTQRMCSVSDWVNQAPPVPDDPSVSKVSIMEEGSTSGMSNLYEELDDLISGSVTPPESRQSHHSVSSSSSSPDQSVNFIRSDSDDDFSDGSIVMLPHIYHRPANHSKHRKPPIRGIVSAHTSYSQPMGFSVTNGKQSMGESVSANTSYSEPIEFSVTKDSKQKGPMNEGVSSDISHSQPMRFSVKNDSNQKGPMSKSVSGNSSYSHPIGFTDTNDSNQKGPMSEGVLAGMSNSQPMRFSVAKDSKQKGPMSESVSAGTSHAHPIGFSVANSNQPMSESVLADPIGSSVTNDKQPMSEGVSCYSQPMRLGVSDGSKEVLGRVKGCLVHACRFSLSKGGVMISLQGEAIISQCDISDVSYGIRCIQNALVVIVKNQIHHCRTSGIFMRLASTGLITGNDIHSNLEAGIDIRKNADPVIQHNRIHNGKRSGIVVLGSGKGLIQKNDIFQNREAGVYILYGGNPTVVGNYIYDGHAAGIAVNEGGRGTIKDNTIERNEWGGIDVRHDGSPLIINNRIMNGVGDGVVIGERGRGQMETNIISGNNGCGVWMMNANNSCIHGNQIYGNMDCGITMVDKSDVPYEQNPWTIPEKNREDNSSSQDGDEADANSHHHTVIEYNNVFHNQGKGMLIQHFQNVLVQFNSIHGNQADGLLVDQEPMVHLHSNMVASNEGSGIVVSNSGHCEIIGNGVYKNRNGGIVCCNQGNINQNDVVANDTNGIILHGNLSVNVCGNRVQSNIPPAIKIDQVKNAVIENNIIHPDCDLGQELLLPQYKSLHDWMNSHDSWQKTPGNCSFLKNPGMRPHILERVSNTRVSNHCVSDVGHVSLPTGGGFRQSSTICVVL